MAATRYATARDGKTIAEIFGELWAKAANSRIEPVRDDGRNLWRFRIVTRHHNFAIAERSAQLILGLELDGLTSGLICRAYPCEGKFLVALFPAVTFVDVAKVSWDASAARSAAVPVDHTTDHLGQNMHEIEQTDTRTGKTRTVNATYINCGVHCCGNVGFVAETKTETFGWPQFETTPNWAETPDEDKNGSLHLAMAKEIGGILSYFDINPYACGYVAMRITCLLLEGDDMAASKLEELQKYGDWVEAQDFGKNVLHFAVEIWKPAIFNSNLGLAALRKTDEKGVRAFDAMVRKLGLRPSDVLDAWRVGADVPELVDVPARKLGPRKKTGKSPNP